MFLLGLNYLRGDTTKPDLTKAFKYFKKILEHKNLMDQFPEVNLVLGYGYALGLGGLKKNFQKAKSFFESCIDEDP
jgi:TPR repeat protein